MNIWTRTAVIIFLSSTSAILVVPAFAQIPNGVSPGAVDRISGVEGRCPTFSWSPVPGAAFHELVVYQLPDEMDIPDSEEVDLGNANQVLYSRVAGGATAWEPDLAECLAPGSDYVWFVRAGFREANGEVVEASEWSFARFFSISQMPSVREVEEALRVLWLYAGDDHSGVTAADPRVFATQSPKTEWPAPRQGAPKSVTSAKTAIKGTVPDATGETYGIVGISNSSNGAGLAAANTGGGADLVLDGSADGGDPDAIFTQAGIDRPSPNEQWFSLINSDSGVIGLNVEGKIIGGSLVIPGSADLSGASVTMAGASITGGTYNSATFSGSHAGNGSGLTNIDAGAVSTGRLAGARLPEHSPWDCRWYISASDSEYVTSDCADGRHLVSGFCYTTDTSCGVGWYRPLGLQDLSSGTHLPDVGTGMYCVFSGTCDDLGSPNKAMSLCCSTD